MSKSILSKYIVPIIIVSLTLSCSQTKYVADGEYLLKGCVVKSHDKSFNTTLMNPYIRQHANSKWFSLFSLPLDIYNLSGRDTTKWSNRMLQRFGEAPVIYDSTLVANSCQDMVKAMQSMGYMNATAESEIVKNNKKVHVIYTVTPGQQLIIDSVNYQIEDTTLLPILDIDNYQKRGLKRGMVFSNENLENERKRLTGILVDNGYYKFNKDFIQYEADSIANTPKVNLTLRLIKFRSSNNGSESNHKKYFINKINYRCIDSNKLTIRSKVLENNTDIKVGSVFKATDLQSTYNNYARLQAIRYTNISFSEMSDTSLLNCDIHISMRKPNTISFQPEGTNTAGDFGAAVSLTYENNNIFRGSELFSVQLRGAFEAITGLEGYQNQNYNEYNVETKIVFPRIIAPLLPHRYRYRNNMHTELLLSYNLQNRPEFHRRVLSSTWRYYWKSSTGKWTYRLDLIDVNYVHMPWISATFKKDYLDDASNRNAILRYNYEDLFILRTGVNITYNNGKHALRTNIELGGNTLDGISHMFATRKNERGQYTLFNIAYAQYVKGDFDYTHLVSIDTKNTLALHLGVGCAYPYGNSSILPFEKRYFSGGANSVRGWNVRELGPGKFKGTDGRIDFINQTGDIKLDLNLELRTYLFWKFNGAFFIDAGNIWTIKNYKDQPGGQFKFDEFYKQIAVAYGVGVRLNFDYFIMRLDLGVKAVNPAYDNSRQHFPVFNPNLKRDLSLHFAVGMPF